MGLKYPPFLNKNFWEIWVFLSILAVKYKHMESLLENAIRRYHTKNHVSNKDYKLSIYEFILTIYLNCDPATYGKHFSNKLIYELKKLFKGDINFVSDNLDRGDFCINYYPKNTLTDIGGYIESKYYEIKTSYLGKNGTYTIRNLRKYQDLDGYLITLVDCENSFKLETYLINPIDLYDNSGLTFTNMNGTKKRNENNLEVGLGTAFRKGSKLHDNIKRLNRLSGNDFKDLYEYFVKINKKLKEEYWKNNTKTNTTVLKFEIDGHEFYENTTSKNYINFINYVYVTKGHDVLTNILHSYYFSSEPIDSKQVYIMDDKFFINTYCSTNHKKRNIEKICKSLGININYYDPEKINQMNYKKGQLRLVAQPRII